MDISALLAFDWYSYLLLPALIFIFRILDASLGTIRVIFISKGFRLLAPVLGFIGIMGSAWAQWGMKYGKKFEKCK